MVAKRVYALDGSRFKYTCVFVQPACDFACCLTFDSVCAGMEASGRNSGRTVRCWWCSKFHLTRRSTRAPTMAYPPWNAVGFFCGVPCCKAYMIQHNIRPFYLKKYLLCENGIPLCTPLPTAPPWQLLAEFSPHATMSRSTYHKNATQWDIPTPGIKEVACPHCHAVKGPNKNGATKRRTKTIKPPGRFNPATADWRPHAPLRRASALPGKKIMDYMQTKTAHGSPSSLQKSPVVVPQPGSPPAEISL